MVIFSLKIPKFIFSTISKSEKLGGTSKHEMTGFDVCLFLSVE